MNKNDNTYLKWTLGLKLEHSVNHENKSHTFRAFDNGKNIGICGEDKNPANAALKLCSALRAYYYKNIDDSKPAQKEYRPNHDHSFEIQENSSIAKRIDKRK